ncbi:5-carboxymethyl-2-hydroxymuconate Delta-isomerase [Granulosicoccus antarcticus]|uniref:5-carboxymethyl-2-hydroxymuconate Delta-isomerase n=1 Tax=Granulosicoccus antarcticus IMCC3135 TaxID=1192854 RepID=A0A2Z2NS63_9GAMM|nr:5-carboxymethyl-2-hydroxymuconate Delta-isomerase [Granulosicoccus antarcticus]ASJ73355.1 5-carboxymethyl-2-hydroxymuconate Delta-isomerase [Granulosicoccus antarcticus IMCC3135]
MPHFQIDYSGNLEAVVDIGGLCEHIRAQAAKIDTFPLAGIRVRAIRVDHYAIADGNDKHGFVDISIRMRGGRVASVKQDAAQRVFEAARVYLESAMQTQSIALSLELRDIDPDLSPKIGTIREHLET